RRQVVAIEPPKQVLALYPDATLDVAGRPEGVLDQGGGGRVGRKHTRRRTRHRRRGWFVPRRSRRRLTQRQRRRPNDSNRAQDLFVAHVGSPVGSRRANGANRVSWLEAVIRIESDVRGR